jgi:4-hydroxybenzoate polyprenyltransferase
MSDIEPRRRSGLSRNARADRAYKLTLATGAFGVATVVLVLLAVLTSVGLGWAILAAIATALSGLLLRRTLNP